MCVIQVGYFVAAMTLLGGANSAEEYVNCRNLCNVTIADVPEVKPNSACVVRPNETYNVSYCVEIFREKAKWLRDTFPIFLFEPTNVELREEIINTTVNYLSVLNAALKESRNRKKLKDIYCETKRRLMKITLLVKLLDQVQKLPSEKNTSAEEAQEHNRTHTLYLLNSIKMDALNSIRCNYSKTDNFLWVINLHNIENYDLQIRIEEEALRIEHIVHILRKRVQPVLSAGMFILGMFFNILMLSIFVRCPQSRAPRNMILLQLAVGDTLSLTINLPVYHTLVLLDLFPGEQPHLRFFEFVRYMCFSIGIFSVVALCFQRYCATLKLTDRGMILRQSTKYSSTLVICTVWFCAIAISVYHAFLCLQSNCFKRLGGKKHVHSLSYVLDFLFLALTPFLIIWILSILTVRHFQERLAQLKISLPPETWEELRQALARSTTVLRLTPLVFGVSFIPFYFLKVTVVLGASINSVWYNCCYVIAYALVFLQTCYNPVSTYVTSSTFRGYFQSYIFCNCYDQTYRFDLQPENLKDHNWIPEEGELRRFSTQAEQD